MGPQKAFTRRSALCTVADFFLYNIGDNGKENGSYYSILGLYPLYNIEENGKENGSYYSILGLYTLYNIGENGKENGNDYVGLRA